jgi:hypothetical protein
MGPERLVRLVRSMNTTDRILGESTSQAFDELMKLSLSLKNGDYSREGILDMVREYERKYGLSDELHSVFVGIIDAIDDYDGYSQHEYFGDLFYTIVYLVQTGKIYTGGLLDQILRGDPFGSNIDLSIPTAESNPYIDAIAHTFDRRATEVMCTAEYIAQ